MTGTNGLRLLALLTALIPGPGLHAAEPFRAGAASIDITPPIGFALWGYSVRKDLPSVGVHDPLKARALVLACGPDRLALVSLDLGRAPPRASTAVIRARARNAGIGTFFLVASHTHHGPVLEVDNWPDAKTSYVRKLEERLGDVILDAASHLQPARIGLAGKDVPLNRNRHSRRPDKPVDRELLVLRVEDGAGRPIAHAVNFAAHPTMINAKSREFSADYPGVLAGQLEKETGAPCLFLQGAAGDLSPNPGTETGPDGFGKALAREAMTLAREIRCTAPERAVLKSREEDFTFTSRIDHQDPLVFATFATAFFPDLVKFYQREYRDGVRPHLTTALLDGRLGFVGVSGEFFCSHALGLKRRARLEHLFFLGYCNDYQQYFPTIEAVAEGGYGADAAMAPAAVGAGERVMDRALIHLYQMRGQIP